MITGPSYSLSTRKAAVQRALNYCLRAVESGNEKAGFYLEQVPGLVRFATLGAEIRGALLADGRLFVVSGATLFEVATDGTATARGTLLTTTGAVDMAYGVLQLVIVDGANGYTLTLSSNTFTRITTDSFYGSARVAYVDGFFLFIRPSTGQFYISSIDDAQTLDALDFATAESSPDDLVSLVVDHREAWLFGETTTEIWFNSGAQFPFERNNGALLEVGCLAPHSAQQIDNSVMWLGRDRNGSGIVWRAQGYQPQRISTFAVEEALQQSTDLTQARAYCYQLGGQTYYALNAPGLSSTWVYEVSSGQWHERVELVSGELQPHRALVHVAAYGKSLVGDVDGGLYYFDANTYTNDGDILYRERTSPHNATPDFVRVTYDVFRLDVEVGITGQSISPYIELTYSDDGGYTWPHPWSARSLGRVGQYGTHVVWHRLGQARDRVWKIRCTDNCKASIINAAVVAQKAAS